jgi:outer membrane protein assembly factor BamB
LALVAVDARAARDARIVYKFATSATLFAPPGLGRDGAVYVGAGDGYVHALAADGSFRWSYTVKGRVTAPPVEDAANGHLFVATSEGRLYALDRDAALRWVFPLPVAPKSELVLTPKGTLFFVGQDDHLYGVTTGGALRLRLAARGARSAPALLAGGQVGLMLGEQLAILKGYGYEHAPLPGSFGASATLALRGDRAIFACEDGVVRVVGAAPGLHAESDCLSPPVRGEDFFAVAEASGDVRLFFDDGTELGIALGAAPLRPSWDAARRRLIVSTATGALSALELTGGP